jgi:phospholipid-binding lipoprotein MlaA
MGNYSNYSGIPAALFLLAVITVMSGCASTGTRSNQDTVDPDPLESANRVSYAINESLDRNLLQPVARTYVKVTPEQLRISVTNFFDNLAYLNVVLNSFLQGKFEDGMSDTMRFLFNSTLGIGGLVDVATDMGFAVHNEDLGQTLATWGFARGAYLYIPLVKGPDTVRDLPDMATRTLLNPLTYVTGMVLFPVSALNIINARANLLGDSNLRDEAALDPYSFTREAFLQRREFLIHDGNPPVEGYESIFDDELDDDSLIIE